MPRFPLMEHKLLACKFWSIPTAKAMGRGIITSPSGQNTGSLQR